MRRPPGPARPGGELDLGTDYLQSKLLSYPNGRFNVGSEDERARNSGYALDRRTLEAATVRIYADELLEDGARTWP